MRFSHGFLATLIGPMFVITTYAQGELPPAGKPAQAGPARPAAPPADPAFRQQVSYALGWNFAMNLKANLQEMEQNGIDLDPQTVMTGINDTLAGAQLKWTDQEMQQVLQRFAQEMQQKAMQRMQRQASKNQQDADAFLARNGKQEGVQTTQSGLQFRIIQQGPDGPSPTISDRVKCNYKGTLLNGTEFDSSAKHGGPAEFPVNQVIPGWTEALQKMRVGDKWQLYVPPKLAYGERSPGPPIEPNSLLVYDIELVEILK